MCQLRILKQLSINSVAIGASADKKLPQRIASCTKVWSAVSVDMVRRTICGIDLRRDESTRLDTQVAPG